MAGKASTINNIVISRTMQFDLKISQHFKLLIFKLITGKLVVNFVLKLIVPYSIAQVKYTTRRPEARKVVRQVTLWFPFHE